MERFYEKEPVDADKIADSYLEAANYLKPYVTETSITINEFILRESSFEGAQGTMLDLDHGTYPYVTSSHPVAGGACIGAGVGPNCIDKVIGVVKAYTTRVGDGPFPTELDNELGREIREMGHEYGVTTGRPRRIGWLDLMVVKYASLLSGFTGVAVTRLDVLSGLERLKVAYTYQYQGKDVTAFPSSLNELASCRPVYKEFEGWPEIDPGARKIEELHPNAQKYLEFVSKCLNLPLTLVSFGRDRRDTLKIDDIF